MKEDELESFRMDLLFERMRIDVNNKEMVRGVNALNLCNFGLTSLRRLRPFVNLVYLDISKNFLTRLDPELFPSLTRLAYLGTLLLL